MDVPQARRLERPGWLNARTVLGVVLFITALLGGQRLVTQARALTPVWVVTQDLPAGSVLGPDAVEAVGVNLPGSVRANYVASTTSLAGAVTVQPLVAGQIVPLAAVAARSEEMSGQLLTVPIANDTVVGSDLRAGDRVTILATFDAGQPGSETHAVAVGVEVVEVVRADGFVTGAAGVSGVTVRVPEEVSARLAFAVRNAQIDLAIQGSEEVGPTSPVTREDFRG